MRKWIQSGSVGKPSRVRAVVKLSVAALLCMLALASHFLWESRARAVNAAMAHTANLVKVVESRVSAEFNLVDAVLTHVAHELPLQALKSGPNNKALISVWSQYLQPLVGVFPSVSQINVFDEHGLLLYSSRPGPVFSIADRPHFQRLREHPELKMGFSGLQHMHTTGRLGIVQFHALRDEQGRFAGMLGAVMNLEDLDKLFNGIDVGPGGLTLLRSTSDYELILRVPHPGEKGIGRELSSKNPTRQLVESGANEGSLNYRSDTDGVIRVVSFRRLEKYPFYVLVAQAEDEYLAGWRRQAAVSAALALVVMAVFGLVTVRLGKTGAEADRVLRQLQSSELRLREAQSIAHIGSWEFDHLAQRLQWSDEMFRILGLSDFHGAPDLDILISRTHPEDVERLRLSLEERRNGGEAYTELEYRLCLPDGCIRHVHETWKTTFNADGSRQRCMGTVQDVTIRKELEQVIETERKTLISVSEQLQESRNLLHTVIDVAPVLILVKDRNGKYLLANSALAQLYHTTSQAMVGCSDADFNLNPEHVEAYERSNREVIESGVAQILFEEATDAATGRTRYFQSIKVPFSGPGNQPCVLVIATDVTELKKTQLQLQASEQRLTHVLAATEEGIYDWHIAQDRIEHNARWGEILGLREVPPSHPLSFFANLLHPEDREAVMAQVQQSLDGQVPLRSEHRMLRADGQVVWVLDRGQVVERASDGTPLRMAGAISDITARKEAQARQALAASVFSNAREGILITDPECHIVDVNDAFTRITGYSREEALSCNPTFFSSSRHEEAFFKALWSDVNVKGFWDGEIWTRHKSGSERAQLMTITAVHDQQQRVSHYMALFSDITEAKETERLLRQFAHFDALTGLPNRVLLADRLNRAMAAAQKEQRPLALAYVDLDGFKTINDTHGHEAGDHVLLTVAERMKECLRTTDTIARLGGDEFVAVLTELSDQAGVMPVVDRMLDTISRPVVYENHLLSVSGSIGVTFFPQPSKIDADQLLRQADQAMYQAKLAGKNRYHLFDLHQHDSLQGRYAHIERIRQALEQGEFELYYQPKVHMRSGRILGLEALLRWRHPQRGMVPPLEFLPLIAQHPVEIDVGWWVIDTALAQMEAWADQGLELPVSVNVSGFHLQQADFVAELQKRLNRHAALPSQCLELEVLESSALSDIDQACTVIALCQRLGVAVALDDFGTGYSTLTHLRRLPVQELKIDRSFVQNMLHEAGDLAILEGIIGLAKAFQRNLVAEGVESVAHGEMLLRLGCEVGQGYGIARPMPGSQIPRWAATWQPDPAWRQVFLVGRAVPEISA